jgi:hypothetical protein
MAPQLGQVMAFVSVGNSFIGNVGSILGLLAAAAPVYLLQKGGESGGWKSRDAKV